MVNFIRIFTQRVLFFFLHTTCRHVNKAVQMAVPLIVTHRNDRTLIMSLIL